MRRPGRTRRGWSLLAGELARQRHALSRVAFWSLLEGVPALLSGRLIAAALDDGFLRHRPAVGFGCLAALLSVSVVGAVASRGMFPWLGATVEPLRDALVRRLVGGTLADAVHSAGRPDSPAVARLTGQVETVRGLVGGMLRSLRRTAVTLVATVAGLFTLAPLLAALVLPPLAVSGTLFALSLRTLADRRLAVVLLDEEIAAESGEVLGGVRDIVACRAERRAAARVGEAIDRQAAAVVRLARAGALRTLVVLLGGQLPLLLVLAAAPWMIRQGQLTSGQLVGAVACLAGSLLPALRSIVNLTSTWGIQLGTVLQRLSESGGVPAPAAGDRKPPAGSPLRASGLGFSYGPHSEAIVDALDLDVTEGDHLAVVGPSGAGKSTLAQLLIGGLAPTGGRVTFDGVPLDRVDPTHLRRCVALIPQEAYVFAGTVRDNFCYLNPGAGDRALDAAVDTLALRPLVDRLGGYDGRLPSGGAGLSGGERQLIAAARVYLSPARLVILDEATCHLDPETEARVEQAFLRRGGALVVIAHRISSAERASRVLLLDGAKATVDSPERLLLASPLYAQLVGYWHDDAASGARRGGRGI
ncbi:ABC transporter ATP-binding protein [Kitasatospora cystarginea]|uniref:ABC transporter ATP-binding protein n=1 Tax=Kitasatospora cystarginea TaxID=58350 RepID=A0ABN3DDB5_9ACTN